MSKIRPKSVFANRAAYDSYEAALLFAEQLTSVMSQHEQQAWQQKRENEQLKQTNKKYTAKTKDKPLSGTFIFLNLSETNRND